jgi:hypothetical protein
MSKKSNYLKKKKKSFTIGKTGNSRSRFRNPIPVFSKFLVSRRLLKLFYDENTQFFYLLCSRRPGLVISTFGLAEIISCMPDGLVKIYIGYWQTIFEISGKASFVEAVLWREYAVFLPFCSQFWQKASGWINKTLLLIKQHITCMNISRCANIDKFVK